MVTSVYANVIVKSIDTLAFKVRCKVIVTNLVTKKTVVGSLPSVNLTRGKTHTFILNPKNVIIHINKDGQQVSKNIKNANNVNSKNPNHVKDVSALEYFKGHPVKVKPLKLRADSFMRRTGPNQNKKSDYEKGYRAKKINIIDDKTYFIKRIGFLRIKITEKN